MSESARKFLDTLEGSTEVEVLQFRQTDQVSGVLRFAVDGVEYEDQFNVNSSETMKTLLEDRSGDKVFVTVGKDDTADKDGHPQILSARIEEKPAA